VQFVHGFVFRNKNFQRERGLTEAVRLLIRAVVFSFSHHLFSYGTYSAVD